MPGPLLTQFYVICYNCFIFIREKILIIESEIHMKKRIAIIGLIVGVCFSLFGCKSAYKSEKIDAESIVGTMADEDANKHTDMETDTKQGEYYEDDTDTEDTTETETDTNDIDEPDTELENDDDSTDTISIEREEKDDGSIYVKVTDGEENLLQTIEYDASKDYTIKYEYEYNEKGVLTVIYDYEGPGNLVDEFYEENYDNATMTGQNVQNNTNDYNVDVENAFVVTIEELEPLYKKAEEIYDEYGVVVLIADKVCDYTSDAELCYDYQYIDECLSLVEACLECYPVGFFRVFNNDWVDATVCIQLVGTGGPAGLYFGGEHYRIVQLDVNDYTPGGEDDGSFFCYTLHHEMGHLISYDLLKRADQITFPLMEERWDSFNPDDFEYVGYYDDQLESEQFSKGNNSEYFIYSYSCSTPEEDRATIFGKAMAFYQGYETMGFTEYVNEKLSYLSACIKDGFIWQDWSEKPAWEYVLDYER